MGVLFLALISVTIVASIAQFGCSWMSTLVMHQYCAVLFDYPTNVAKLATNINGSMGRGCNNIVRNNILETMKKMQKAIGSILYL